MFCVNKYHAYNQRGGTRAYELIFANCLIPVSPQRPQIEYADKLILPGSNVTARAGETATLKCTARYGNPSPLIKWFVKVVC